MNADRTGVTTAVDEASPVAPDEQQEWRAVAALLAILPSALDAQLRRDAGMNLFEYQVLQALAEAPGRTLVLTHLAETAQGSLSRLSHAVTRFERSGWVRRRTCTTPGVRGTEAWLTEAGLAKLAEATPGHLREVRRLVLDVVTPQQLAALADAARTITADGAAACREDGAGC